MSRPLRIQYPGALYHITARGNGRERIYLTDQDRRDFLAVFSDVIERYRFIPYAYCLMPNHYHLVVETPEANLSRGLRQLNGVYTQHFNIRHRHVGHLFQGRFKAILVEKQAYLGELLRYIALNPVRAKLSRTPAEWRWSSHGELIGRAKPTGCVDIRRTLALFHRTPALAKKEYLRFVGEKTEVDIEREVRGGAILGTGEFIKSLGKYLGKKKKDIEIAAEERLVHRPELARLFAGSPDKKRRNRLIREANVRYGYTLSEIGRHVGLHYTSISLIVKRTGERKRKPYK